MKLSRPHSSSVRWALLVLLFSISSGTSFAQSVAGFLHGKIQNFQQTSPAVPVANPTEPFQFGSLLSMGTATINSATLTFSGTSSPRAYTSAGAGAFSILDTFATQGQLDAAYQSGNFTVSIDTSAGVLSRTIFLFPFSYPTTPLLTVPAGDWQSGSVTIDPAFDYTLTWNSFANAQAIDVIQLLIRDSIVITTPFPATQTSFTIPAGSLQPNTTYACDLAFVRVAGATAGDTDIGPGYATLDRDTRFTISTVTSGPTPSPSPTATAAPTATATPTASATATPTAAPTATPTSTPTATPTSTPPPTPTPTPTPVVTPTPGATSGTLGNISTRLQVETGNNVLIGGFIITGTQPKKVIVRAIGPSLSSFFTGVLTDPFLELRDSSGSLIGSNDNWRSNQEKEIIATGIPPANNLESAIVATLPANGSAYTAIVRGVSDGTGIAVVEAYDLDQTVDSKLANIATRGLVQTGNNVLIGGLIVLGQDPLRVIVRAIGPSLPLPGALADPTLELRDGNGALLASNDNWRTTQEAEIIATGIPPSNDQESAIVSTLPAVGAAYTAIVRGTDNTTGIAVVEVYGLN